MTTLELVLALPMLMVAVLAIFQFGMLTANQLQLIESSRAAARIAAQLSLNGAVEIPAEVRRAIHSVLGESKIQPAAIVLEHNDGGTRSELIWGAAGRDFCDPARRTDSPTKTTYVRVTVCVEASKMAPNALKTLGFDASELIISSSTTFPHMHR